MDVGLSSHSLGMGAPGSEDETGVWCIPPLVTLSHKGAPGWQYLSAWHSHGSTKEGNLCHFKADLSGQPNKNGIKTIFICPTCKGHPQQGKRSVDLKLGDLG